MPSYEVDQVTEACAQPPWGPSLPAQVFWSTCEGPGVSDPLTILTSRDAVEALELCEATPTLAADLLAQYEAHADGGTVDFETHEVIITAREVEGTDGLVVAGYHSTWIGPASVTLRFDVVDSSGTCTANDPHTETAYTLWVAPAGAELLDCSRAGAFCGDPTWAQPAHGWR